MDNEIQGEEVAANPEPSIFGGNLSIKQGLNELRLRLLDLTGRNRLINYKHTPGRSLQFVHSAMGATFRRLVENNNQVTIAPLPEPLREEWVVRNGKAARPDPKEHAANHEISADYELVATGSTGGNGNQARTLFYADDLGKHCRKLEREAKLAIAETGSNMLYLVFGFLDFPDTPAAEKTYRAPLLCVPVSIQKVEQGPYTTFSLAYTGDDITDNMSLREKVRRDFGLQIPEYAAESEMSVDAYLREVSNVIANKPEWHVRRMMTLTLLSFANMLLVRDLDPENWANDDGESDLTEHPLVRQVFEGQSEAGGATYAGEYPIDNHPKQDIPLIYDADSSQHSALIDVLEGHNRVIEGPPGTGKSQTITNLIAAALQSGKKVLFVAEKLAALQVVKSRLALAGLDPFVLELHSNKANRKKVLEELHTRINNRPRTRADLPSLIEQFQEKRAVLKAYTETVNSRVGDHKELTLHQVMWRAELHRMRCGGCFTSVQHLDYSPAYRTDATTLSALCDRLNYLAGQYEPIGSYSNAHPLWGFFPEEFKPEDDLPVQRLLAKYQPRFQAFKDVTASAAELVGVATVSIGADESKNLLSILENLSPADPGEIDFGALPLLFPEDGSDGRQSKQVLDDLSERQALLAEIESDLRQKLVSLNLSAEQSHVVEGLRDELRHLGLDASTYDDLEQARQELLSGVKHARAALTKLAGIAKTCGLPFTGAASDIAKLTALVKPLSEAPVQLLPLRHPALANPGAAQKLRTARVQLTKLSVAQRTLEERYYLDAGPTEDELRAAIATLREGDAWYRIFQRSWRTAIRLHRRLERTKSKSRGSERLAELERLSAHRQHQKTWLADELLRTLAGPHFAGEQTPLEDLAKVAEWLQEATLALEVAQVPKQIFDPLTTERTAFLSLATQVPVLSVSLSALDGLMTTGSRILSKGTKAILRGLDLELFGHRADVMEKATASIGRIQRLMKGLVKEEIAAGEGLRALAQASALPEKISELENHLAGRQLLSDRFQGRKTNLEPLLAAHTYGTSMVRANLPRNIERVLLSEDCTRNHERLGKYFRGISQGWTDLSEFSDGMARYGRFDLSAWVSAEFRSTPEYAVELAAKAERAANNLGGLLPWAQYVGVRAQAAEAGLEPFIQTMESNAVPPEKLRDAFVYRFYASIAQEVFSRSPRLRQFSGRRHSAIREEFAELDKKIIKLRGEQIAHDCVRASQPPGGSNSARVDEKTELSLINYLIPQQRPRVTVRAMLSRAGRAIQELKPCFMMGPQAVAQFLEPGKLGFDLVVMDEASQLRPEQAIGAIARGAQLVVVGDPKQLPPTSFFSRANQTDGDDDSAQLATSDAESILDVCTSHFQPVRTLRWHYRSRHESLIAFSNHNFYRSQLVVFPSPYPRSKLLGLSYHYVANGVYESQMNQIEAVRVVEAAVEHILTRPDDSLGIVTLNVKQRDLIAELLEQRLRTMPEAREFRERWEAEGMDLFVNNLENVQGDERDCIVISTTFGKPAGASVVRQNFGPISRQGGWRRLNVLFTRARKAVAVYTSMRPEDIVSDNRTPEGTRALRNYLEFARTGLLPIEVDTGLPPDSDFEVSVIDTLREHGYESTPQLGVAGFRIDIAVKHPKHLSGYLAAIECDGATYHSAVSVRDRDRIRQEILEGLGWRGRIWRIWSTDWFRSPLAEMQRLLAFLKALEQAPVPEEFLVPYVHEEPQSVVAEGRDVEAAKAAQAVEDVQEDGEGELEVQVGDLVTYAPEQEPDKALSVKLTNRQTDLNAGLVAESTPLGSILLGASPGDTVVLRLPGKGVQSFVVLKVQRPR
jgi:transcription elongation GreA/GreB family factor